MKNYRQCRLQHGTQETTAWIDAKARVGSTVQILEDDFDPDEVWEVVEQYGNTLPEPIVKLIQQLHRNSLPSVEGMG